MIKALLLVAMVSIPVVAFAQTSPVIPEFPVVLSTILGMISTTVVQFLKRILPENGLVRLLAAAVLSAAVGVVGAFIAGVDLGVDDGAFFLTVVFAYSQVGWAAFKNIREVFE